MGRFFHRRAAENAEMARRKTTECSASLCQSEYSMEDKAETPRFFAGRPLR
jgi:hypothetical protein